MRTMVNESGMNQTGGYKSHVNYGSNITAKRMYDTSGSRSFQVPTETVTFATGAAGTSGVVTLICCPVTNASHAVIGNLSDTSFAWVTGTILTTQVAWRIDQTQAVQLAALANGEYAINYDTGEIRYKKATAGTSDTCNYWTRRQNVEIDELDIEIGAVEIKDHDSTTRAEVHAPNSAALGTGLNILPARYLATPGTVTDTYTTALLLDSVGKLRGVGDGLYAAGTNAVPNTTGLIFHAAAAAPANTDLTIRTTAGKNDADGLVAANIWGLDARSLAYGFNGTTWDRLWAFVHDQDLSAVTEKWQGIGGWDETANKFAALPIVTDNAAMPTAAQGVPLFGEYNTTLPTYNDGDAAVLQLDDRGRLITAVELNDYVDDSNEFTIATSKMLAIGGVATTDAVDAGDVGAFKMDIYRQLATGIWDSTGAYRAEVLAAGADTVANTTDSLVVSNWNYSFNGSSWDRVRDATALTDTTLAGTLGSFHNAETGIQVDLMMGYDNTAGANAYRAVAVSALGAFKVDTDGYYVVGTNPIPDTEGLVVCQPVVAPGNADYIIRPSGGLFADSIATATTTVRGIDTRALMGGIDVNTATTWSSLNTLTQDAAFGTAARGLALFGKYQATPTTYNDNDAAPILLDQYGKVRIVGDGIWLASNPLPNSCGITANTAGAAPDATTQVERITAGTAALMVSGVPIANFHGLDARSLCGGINAAKVYPFDACAVSAGVTYGLSVGIFDALGNRMPAGDSATRPIYVEEVGAPGSLATFRQFKLTIAAASQTMNNATLDVAGVAWGSVVAKEMTFTNMDLANTIYIKLDGGTATTSYYPLRPGATWVQAGSFTATVGISFIADGAGTDLRIIAAQ